MPSAHAAAHPHPGAVVADEARHGFIFLHLSDFTNLGTARTRVSNVSVPQANVTLDTVQDMLAVLVEDATQPPMDRAAFHLFLDRLAAKYLALGSLFTFERHF